MTACGFTPVEIDEMAMHELLALLSYWSDWPPTHEILAAVHQVARAPATTGPSDDPSGIGGLVARFPDGRVTTR